MYAGHTNTKVQACEKKYPHLTLWYWEQISDSFIVRVPEQCNEEQFGHLGMQVGEEN